MRLICPNCGAQYEVGEDVIPEAGRDVQCSNCSHTWFEQPGASVAAEEADQPDTPEPGVPPQAEPEPDPDPKPEPAPEPEPEPAPAFSARSTVSPEIARILQEEAAREEAVRRKEAQVGLETQPDLGLEAPLDREAQLAEEARRRMARMRGEPAPAVGAPVTGPPGSRRELLPDIEEINSSLRSSADRAEMAVPSDEQAEVQSRRSFRYGFSLVVLVCAGLALTYTQAPRIASAVPQTGPMLDRYVAAVDSGRIWFDIRMQGLLARIDASDEPTPDPDSDGGPTTGTGG